MYTTSSLGTTHPLRFRPSPRAPWWRSGLTLLLAACLGLVAQSSLAAFPGKNGTIVYGTYDPEAFGSKLWLVDEARQITFGNRRDFSPTFSPDGQRIAYIEESYAGPPTFEYMYSIKVVNKGGTGGSVVASSHSFPGLNTRGAFDSVAWSRDGLRLFFSVFGGTDEQSGIWSVGGTGGGLTRVTTREGYTVDVNASPLGPELVFACTFRGIRDLCIYNELLNTTKPLSIDLPGDFQSISSPHWMPDGERIVFAGKWEVITGPPNDFTGVLPSISHWDLFMIDANGHGLRQVTTSEVLCPGIEFATGLYEYLNPVPSPDGASILTERVTKKPVNEDCSRPADPNQPPYNNVDGALYTVNLYGGGATLVAKGWDGTFPAESNFVRGNGYDWQPLPADLTVKIDDGHGHPLDGLKVQVRDKESNAILYENPTHNGNGTYIFKDVPPNDYLVRTTLMDFSGGPGSTPAFEIRHGLDPTEAAWVEHKVTVKQEGGTIANLGITVTDTSIFGANSSEPLELDDIAAIYYNVQRYVAWVKRTLTPQTGATVIVHAFAATDPTDGQPFSPSGARYWSVPPLILLGTDFSRYEYRDGLYNQQLGDEAPENGEWHEFNHHLWFKFVDTTAAACAGENHAGYRNPDTCDSMSEGFASFLAAAAARDIDGATDSFYDGSWDLEAPLKAWSSYVGSDGTRVYEEDVAVSALLWDLHDAKADRLDTEIIAQSGVHEPVTYTDEESESLVDLWTRFITAKPLTVDALRMSYGTPDLSIDLDEDGLDDIARIDQVFLKHGFFPIDLDETLTSSHRTYHYDVDYAQRTSITAARNAVVGWSSHRTLAANGSVLNTFIPRFNMPMDRNANLAVNVEDEAGTPLSGAEVELVIHYPGGQSSTSTRRLEGGTDNLLSLQLPPYYDYLLPEDAPLPECDPVNDEQVTVTMHIKVNGYLSADSPSFDNCTYQQAVAASTGQGALSFTATFPQDATPPESTIDTVPSDDLVAGATTGFWIVRLACADPADSGFAAGCARIEYSLDEGPFADYQRSVHVTGVGPHTFAYRSVDAAGNEESLRSVELEIVPPLAATIDGFAPSAGPAETLVTITGTNLDDVTGVTFNGTAATFTRVSQTQVTTVVPAGATTGPIAVTNAGGTVSSASDFVVASPPSPNGFSPSSGTVGTLVTISGEDLGDATAVMFNGTLASFTVLSATQIQAAVPPGATTGPLAVTTPGGTRGTLLFFTVLQPPTITGFSPAEGAAGTVVTITGTNLGTTSSVRFNGFVASFEIVSSTQITSVVPAGAVTGLISVTTASGERNSPTQFVVLVGPAPSITSVSPASGGSGTAVTIKGANLGTASAVRFNGVAATFRLKGSAVSTTVPAGATTGPVTVTAGGGTATSPVAFVVPQPPTIAGFTPASGPVGTALTITGTNLGTATSVKIGGSTAGFTVFSDTAISATVPKGGKSGPVSVTTPGGTTSGAGTFTVVK